MTSLLEKGKEFKWT
jgi:hypothetical protein